MTTSTPQSGCAGFNSIQFAAMPIASFLGFDSDCINSVPPEAFSGLTANAVPFLTDYTFRGAHL